MADPAETGEAVPLRLRDHSAIEADLAIERKQRNDEMWRMIDANLLQPCNSSYGAAFRI